MAELRELIKGYLESTRVMQLATVSDNKPWVCNVHYFSDDDLNIYWISLESRKHSQDIQANPNVGVAVKVHEDTDTENYVVGLSITGTAEIMGDNLDESIMQAYFTKIGSPPAVQASLDNPTNQSKFYRLTPDKIVLFDTVHFKEEPRQEFIP